MNKIETFGKSITVYDLEKEMSDPVNEKTTEIVGIQGKILKTDTAHVVHTCRARWPNG